MYTITKRSSVKLAVLALLLGGARQVMADVTIDFEGYSQGTYITNQYNAEGVDFANAIILSAGQYNDSGYPPHSGANVVYSGASNSIEADAVGASWSHVSLWYTANTSDGLFIDAYDASNNLIDEVHGGQNYGTNSMLSLFAPNISHVIVHDSGNFFTMDDFTFTPSQAPTPSVPEPSTLICFGGMSLLGLAISRRRRRVASTVVAT